MYLFYADDAGNTGIDLTNEQQPIFCLCGVVVPEERWTELNARIGQKRAELVPENPEVELHAVDIFNGSKNRKKGIDYRSFGLERNFKIIESVVDLIVEMQLPVIAFLVKKDNLRKYCLNHYGGMIKIDPYFIALPYVMSFFDAYLQKANTQGIMFLDEQTDVYGRIDRVVDQLKIFSESNAILHSERIIERSIFLSSEKSNFVQMADMCAYIICRRNTLFEKGGSNKPEKDEFIREMYKKIQPLIIEPPFNPHRSTEALKFFDDNYLLLAKE